MGTTAYFVAMSFVRKAPHATLRFSGLISVILTLEILISLFFWVVLFPQILGQVTGRDGFFIIFPHIAPIVSLSLDFHLSNMVVRLRHLK